MTFTSVYPAGEGYEPSAISLHHTFAINQFVKAEDLPNTTDGTLNSVRKFGGPF